MFDHSPYGDEGHCHGRGEFPDGDGTFHRATASIFRVVARSGGGCGQSQTRALNVMGSCRRWHYGGPNSTKLSGAAFASRLEDGNTLITDSNNSRIVEVTPGGKVVWQYVTNTRPGGAWHNPSRRARCA